MKTAFILLTLVALVGCDSPISVESHVADDELLVTLPNGCELHELEYLRKGTRYKSSLRYMRCPLAVTSVSYQSGKTTAMVATLPLPEPTPAELAASAASAARAKLTPEDLKALGL